MARPTRTKEILTRCAEELTVELDSPGLKADRKKAVVRQLAQVGLALARIEHRAAVKREAKPKAEPAPPAEAPAPVPYLLGGEDPAQAMLKKIREAAIEPPPAVPDNESPSEETADAVVVNPAPAAPTPEDDPAEKPEREADSEPDNLAVRKTDDGPTSELMIARHLWGRDRRSDTRVGRMWFVEMPGVLPVEELQRPPTDRPSSWGLTIDLERTTRPVVVDNSDWQGNPLQDARHTLQPEPKLAPMERPARDLRKFLNDVATGRDDAD